MKNRNYINKINSEREPHTRDSTGGSQSVKRAIKLLKAIYIQRKEGSNLTNLSRYTGLNLTTTHRILNALTEEDFVTYEKETKIYRLGIGLMILGMDVQESNLKYYFKPALNRLAKETQDTVLLMVRQGHEMLCIDRVEGDYPIRTYTFNVGDKRPMGLGAGSLAVLSVLPDKMADKSIKLNERAINEMSGLNPEELRALVKKSRKLGYGISQGLVNHGVTGVALPVLTKDAEPYAAISVSAVHERLKLNRRKTVVNLIKAELAELYRELGY